MNGLENLMNGFENFLFATGLKSVIKGFRKIWQTLNAARPTIIIYEWDKKWLMFEDLDLWWSIKILIFS